MVAVLDANVLYPAVLRDLLLTLADAKLFQPKWSERIHDEWTRNLLSNRPDLNADALKKTKQAMDTAFPDASVAGDEKVEASLQLPDTDDRHVLMSAILGNAQWIVTANVKDFPAAVLDVYPIAAVHPDEFVTGLLQENEAGVKSAFTKMVGKLKNPPLSIEQVLQSLVKCDMPQTAALLSKP